MLRKTGQICVKSAWTRTRDTMTILWKRSQVDGWEASSFSPDDQEAVEQEDARSEGHEDFWEVRRLGKTEEQVSE